MRYIARKDVDKTLATMMDQCGSIDVSGSVLGMQKLYGWPKGGQVRIGGYIYNVGARELDRARALGVLRGER